MTVALGRRIVPTVVAPTNGDARTPAELARPSRQEGHGVGSPTGCREVNAGFRDQALIGAAVILVALVLLALVGMVGAVLGEPFQVFTKEPVEQFDAGRAYTGILAHVTWFLWVVGLSLALFAVYMLRRERPGDPRIGFLLAAGAFTAVLLADDFMLVHDRIFPSVGLPEEGLYVAYAIGFVLLLVRFGRQFRQADVLLAGAAGAFWGLSLGMDFIQEHAGIHLHVIEDSAKLIGTALWAAFLVRASRAAVLDCVTTGSGRVDRRA